MGISDPSNQINITNTSLGDDVTPPNFPGVEVPHDVSFQGPAPSDNEEKSESGHRDENFPDEIEVLREAVPDISPGKLPPVSPNCRNDVTEPHESIDVAMNEKEILSPIMEDKTPGGLSLHEPSSGPPPASVASLQDGLEIINSSVSFGESSIFIILTWECNVEIAQIQLSFSFSFLNFSSLLQQFDQHHLLSSQNQDQEKENRTMTTPQC